MATTKKTAAELEKLRTDAVKFVRAYDLLEDLTGTSPGTAADAIADQAREAAFDYIRAVGKEEE